MSQPYRIAIDAMGGDHAPAATIEGLEIALERYPAIVPVVVGIREQLEPLIASQPRLSKNHELVHAPDIIPGDMKPSLALRNGRESSMRFAIDQVEEGKADCIVSAGNTGALMVTAKFVLKTLTGITRPAIASYFPTQTGESVMLDLGANVECSAKVLVEFALMGAVFASAVLGRTHPSVGLLNIGEEEMKGHENLREAAAMLRELDIPGEFKGFIEGNDIPAGAVDVIVTDGFSGNIALKTAEGTAKLFSSYLKRSVSTSILAKIGFLLAQGALKDLKARMDPRRYNGGVLLGLRGVCVKSHGGTDAVGFANAIGVAHDLVAQRVNEKIRTGVEALQAGLAETEETGTTGAEDAKGSADAVTAKAPGGAVTAGTIT